MVTQFVRKILLIFIITGLNIQWSFAATHYLPIKTDPLIELELDKLATLAKMPVLSKPYHIATVQQYLSVIKESHPLLHKRISDYISRYKHRSNIDQFSAEIAYSDFNNKPIGNSRGKTTDNHLELQIGSFFQITENLNISLGGTYLNESSEFIPNRSYISYKIPYMQIDIGYKETWLSPLQESAMLLSTNAKPIGRFSISSPEPITDYKVEYDISFGKLEKMQGIRFNNSISEGEPGFIAMHFSAQFVDWWTLGVSRTMVFGGGNRKKVGLGDVWDAFIDPVNSDNCGGASNLQNCDNEFGNQQASISSKFDLNWGMPFQLNVEIAGEDTNDFKPYKLGNKTYSVGMFLPYLTENSSLLLETQYVENGWYVHSLYQEGYRNDLKTIGHWWGDEKRLRDGIGARITTLRYNYQINNDFHLDVKLSSIKNTNLSDEGNHDESVYQVGNQITLGLNQVFPSSVLRYEIFAGEDVKNNSFAQLSLKYSWQ